VTDWDTEGGGHQKIYRGYASGTAVINSGAGTSGPVDIRQGEHMSFVVAATAWTAASMSFRAAHSATAATFWPVHDSDGAIPRIAASRGSLYGTNDVVGQQHYVRFWSENGSYADTSQTGNRVIRYYLKG